MGLLDYASSGIGSLGNALGIPGLGQGVGSAFGLPDRILNGKAGTNAGLADPRQNSDAMKAVTDYNYEGTSPEANNAIAAYNQGGSLSDALKSLQGNPGALNAFLTNGASGSKAASDFMRTDPGSAGLFGAGGIQDQAQGRFGQLAGQYDNILDHGKALQDQTQQDRGQYMREANNTDNARNQLSSDRGLIGQDRANLSSVSGMLDEDRNALKGRDSSYGLNPEDLAAYGQGSGNIGRMFANQEQSLAQSLADRGLAAAPSGAGVQGFSNLYGDKNEQLAGLQQQISQNRINTAQQLAQARSNADLGRLQQANNTYGTTQGLLNTDVGNINANVGAMGEANKFLGNSIANQDANTKMLSSVGDQSASNNNLMASLGNTYNAGVGNQYNRQLAGGKQAFDQVTGTAGDTMQNQALQQNILNEQYNQTQKSKQPGMIDQLGGAIAAAPGQVVSGAAGGAGAGAGKQAGSSLAAMF